MHILHIVLNSMFNMCNISENQVSVVMAVTLD